MLFLVAHFTVSANEKYLVIEGTESPNHRYAVAEDATKEKNYVVDLKAKKIVGGLASTYSTQNQHENIEAVWSAQSDVLVVSYTHRYGECGTFEAARISGGKAGLSLDLNNKALEESFRAFLVQNFGKGYTDEENSVSFGYDTVKNEADSNWRARAVAVVPGSKNPESFYAETTIHFKLTTDSTARSKLKFELVKIEELESEAKESPSPTPP